MERDLLIDVEQISKKFCRGLKRSLWYGLHDIGRELLGRDRSHDLRTEEFWAVRDLSLQVRRGELLGIIGPNGSGKTTLLRLLNGLLMPDLGCVTIRGRVGALIQLGAGFSPVLTGRENIFINAAVLGISRQELLRALGSIIEFANLGEFIDAPVQSYSSGMRARLGFSVAIHMRPDILLVDEVLSVGDLTFRNKAMERMDQLAHSGVAVIFISHNLTQIDRLCTHALYLNKGRAITYGPTAEVIAHYIRATTQHNSIIQHYPGTEQSFLVTAAGFCNAEGQPVERIQVGEQVVFRITLEVRSRMETPLFCFMWEPVGRPIILAYTHQPREESLRPSLDPGRHTLEIIIPSLPFLPGHYQVRLSVAGRIETQLLGKVDRLATLEVTPRPGQFIITNEAGFLELDGEWRLQSAG
ncbi:MAG: ABC transporter ATP-binding protein [Magnetococcales bacterium]|nr:ABC transporter ATP-binding protein [Magnetococcales bacterium]NGZ07215.1 ABC transporter ATP-binding protein [Magnetococcales bacterium]